MVKAKDPHLRGLTQRRNKSSTRYYYWVDRSEPPIYLGKDEIKAKQQVADLNAEVAKESYENLGKIIKSKPTFGDAIEKYRTAELPKKKEKTQREYRLILDRLEKMYGHMKFENIHPHHIKKHIDLRSDAPVMANREKSMISTVWNNARGWGMTNNSNPCEGIKGKKEEGRHVYVEDELFRLVYDQAEDYIRLAMRLAYYMSQRPGDARKASEKDITNGFMKDEHGSSIPIEILAVTQNKRGKKLRLKITGELKEVIDDIRIYKNNHGAIFPQLLCKNNQPLTEAMLRNGFDKAREKAGIDFDTFQFRDIRAKSVTDIDDESGKEAAINASGHDTEKAFNMYIRNRRGKLVNPVSKKI